jgi:hypothetical protein
MCQILRGQKIEGVPTTNFKSLISSTKNKFQIHENERSHGMD